MNILFITAELINSATGYCAKTVANELAKRGHYVYIVSANQIYSEIQEYDGHLIVQEIPTNYIKRFRINCINSNKARVNKIGTILTFVYKILVQIKGIFTLIPLFDDINSFLKSSSSIIETNEIHMVIPVVNPRESIVVAKKLYKKYGVPYVPYYLDSIYGNIALRILPENIYKKRALEYEQKWVSDATEIIMMQSVKSLYERVDATKYQYITLLTFLDIPLLTTALKTQSIERKSIFEGQFAILFIGTMPNRLRDPRKVFKMADMIAKKDVHFYFAGKTDYMSDLKKLISKNKNIHFLGLIDHDEIINYVEGASALLNIGNNIPGMLPSKVFEYMSYGKPIISTIKDSTDLSVLYLNYYKASLIIDETSPLKLSVEKVNNFIHNIMDERYNIDVSEICEKNSQLYLNTPSCFCEKIEKIVFNLNNK